MRTAGACFFAGVALTGAAIVAAGGAGQFLAGVIVAIAATVAGLVAIGPGRAGTFLVAIADALEAVQTPAPEFTETRAEVVAELVRDGVDYDDADAAVSQTAATGSRDRRAWLKRSRTLLKSAAVTHIDTGRHRSRE